MIRVSLTTLLLIYLAGMLALVCIAWVSAAWRRRSFERHASRHMLRCALCCFEFEDASDALLPGCPRCGSRNERRRRSRL